MGRPGKGKLAGVSPRGRPVRVTERLVRHYYPHWPPKRRPRGKAAGTFSFTNLLKERAPLVYVFVVGQLKQTSRHPGFQKIIEEWRQTTGSCKDPGSRAITAYILERALEGTWEKYSIKAPFSSGEHDSFYRRYVYGHPGAIKTFRHVLRQRPWDRWSVALELRWFLGRPGDATRHY